MFLAEFKNFFERENSFNQYKQFIMKKISFNKTKGCNLCIYKSNFVSPIHTFSLAGNIIDNSPIQGTNRGEYFNQIIYKGKVPTVAGLNTLPSISSFIDRVFSIFRQKMYGFNPSEMYTKVLIPAPPQ